MHVVLLLLECDIYPSIGTTPLSTRWPEQSVLGQQTLVSGHLEFSLKTTPGNRIVATLGPYKCCYTSYTPIQVQSTNETSKLWIAVHV